MAVNSIALLAGRAKVAAPSRAEDDTMAKGEQRSNRETKKPKKDKIKTIAAAPTMKGLMHPEPDKSKKK
jgi:hypothetical protein